MPTCSFAAPRTKLDVCPRAPSFIPSNTHDPASLRVSPGTIQTPVPAVSAGAPRTPVLEERTASRHAEDSMGQAPTSGAEPASPSRATLQRFPSRPESPLAHARRGAGPNAPPAQVEKLPTKYRLSIALPRPGGVPLAPEMITVSARRGARLAVVADAWHLEHDCEYPLSSSVTHSTQADDLALDRSAGHYEWHIAFPQPDVNLGAVRARFGEDGMLVIDVPRRPQASQTICLA